MKNRYFSLLALATVFCSQVFAAGAPSIGIVNFSNCITDSKLGKQEQASFEALKNQMTSLIENTEKQLNELNAKFSDTEYLDGLSPEAETELKNKFRALNEEMSRYQNQYYQVLNQANMRIIQSINAGVNTASESIAKKNKLTVVLNKDACFYFSPDSDIDITQQVINKMDEQFDQQEKAKPAATATPTHSEPKVK